MSDGRWLSLGAVALVAAAAGLRRGSSLKTVQSEEKAPYVRWDKASTGDMITGSLILTNGKSYGMLVDIARSLPSKSHHHNLPAAYYKAWIVHKNGLSEYLGGKKNLDALKKMAEARLLKEYTAEAKGSRLKTALPKKGPPTVKWTEDDRHTGEIDDFDEVVEVVQVDDDPPSYKIWLVYSPDKHEFIQSYRSLERAKAQAERTLLKRYAEFKGSRLKTVRRTDSSIVIIDVNAEARVRGARGPKVDVGYIAMDANGPTRNAPAVRIWWSNETDGWKTERVFVGVSLLNNIKSEGVEAVDLMDVRASGTTKKWSAPGTSYTERAFLAYGESENLLPGAAKELVEIAKRELFGQRGSKLKTTTKDRALWFETRSIDDSSGIGYIGFFERDIGTGGARVVEVHSGRVEVHSGRLNRRWFVNPYMASKIERKKVRNEHEELEDGFVVDVWIGDEKVTVEGPEQSMVGSSADALEAFGKGEEVLKGKLSSWKSEKNGSGLKTVRKAERKLLGGK